MSKIIKSCTALVVAAVIGVPNVSFALDSSFEAMSRSGDHKFYVWCTGKDDYTTSQSGANAQEAQAAVASKAGNNCWPVWQGVDG